jgi:hypothetical protein
MNCARIWALCGAPGEPTLAERCADFTAELLASGLSPQLRKAS